MDLIDRQDEAAPGLARARPGVLPTAHQPGAVARRARGIHGCCGVRNGRRCRRGPFDVSGQHAIVRATAQYLPYQGRLAYLPWSCHDGDKARRFLNALADDIALKALEFWHWNRVAEINYSQ
jgi:hypothetical protein